MTVQIRNPENIDILATDFQRRNEPNFAWQNALSMYSLLPGLRGFWPMSAFDANGYPQDLSGNSNHVDAVVGSPLFYLHGLAPFSEYEPNEAFSVTDRADLDITGVETFAAQASQGLTACTWARLETLQECGFLAKWEQTADQRSYALVRRHAGFVFTATDLGTWATMEQVVTSHSEAVDTWYFICGTWSTAGFQIFVGAADDNTLTKDTAATTHASIFSGSAKLDMGVWNEAAVLWLDGYLSLPFVCNFLLPDYLINALFGHSRWMFRGV